MPYMQKLAIILCFALAGTTAAEPGLRASRELAYQRRELGFVDAWYTLLNKVHMPCPPGHTDAKPKGHCAHRSHHMVEKAGQVDEAEISDENSAEEPEEGNSDEMTNWKTSELNSNQDTSDADSSIVGDGDSAKIGVIGALLAGLLVGIAAFLAMRVSTMPLLCTYMSILSVLTYFIHCPRNRRESKLTMK